MSSLQPYEPGVKAAIALSLLGVEVGHARLLRLSGRERESKTNAKAKYTPDDMLNIRARLAGLDPAEVRAAMSKNRKLPTFIVTRMTKGGVGKTSITVNLAVCFALMGYRTLLIDADHQATASSMLGIDDEEYNEFHIGKLLHNASGSNEPDDMEPYIKHIFANGYLDLIASDVELDSFNTLLFAKMNREQSAIDFARRNQDFLSKNYDVVFVDTNPGTSQISLAFTFLASLSQRILTIVEPEGSCLRALNALKLNVDEVVRHSRRNIDVSILINKSSIGRKKTEENMALLMENYPQNIIRETIPQSIAFSRQVNADDVTKSAPVVLGEPNTKVADSLYKVASLLVSLYGITQPGFKKA